MNEGYEVIGFDKVDKDTGYPLIVDDIVTHDFTKTLNDYSIDGVFHLAGVLGTTELFHRVIEAERVNVQGTLNLLEAMRKTGVNNLVFTSKPNLWRYNPYTITKENCERYLQMYRHIYGMNTCIVKPYNVYGPDEPLTEYRKAIPYFIIQALRDEPLEVFGDGRQLMDCIYVEDTVEAMRRCMEIQPSETVEIGRRSIPVNTLARLIINLVQSNSEIIHTPMRKGEDSPRVCANNRMNKLIKYVPPTGLVDGLVQTIDWYEAHLDEYQDIYKFSPTDFQ